MWSNFSKCDNFDFQGKTVCFCRWWETLSVLFDERRSHLRSPIWRNRRESSRPQRPLLSRNLDGLVGQQRLRPLRDGRGGWTDQSFYFVESIKGWKTLRSKIKYLNDCNHNSPKSLKKCIFPRHSWWILYYEQWPIFNHSESKIPDSKSANNFLFQTVNEHLLDWFKLISYPHISVTFLPHFWSGYSYSLFLMTW